MSAVRANVLFVDHVPETGGGQVVLQTLLRALDRNRYRPAVACAPDGPLWRFCQRQGIPRFPHWLSENVRELGRYQRRPRAAHTLAREVLTAVARLRAALKLHDAALVHCNSNKDDLLGGIAGRLERVAVVWHMHDMLLPNVMPSPTVRALRAAAWVACDRAVSVSQAVADSLRAAGFPPGRVRTVLNGVFADEVRRGGPGRLRRELKLPALTPVVGMVGRLCPWKGQHVFLQAAARLADRHRAHFVLIGGDILADRGYRSELESLARQLGIAERVTFTGHREDRLGLLHDLDVLVHASVEPEPFGLVLVEGMLAGKPVIAADAGGAREIVVPESTGLLTAPGDADALADACERLLAQPDFRAELGRQGQQRARRLFSAERMAREVERVYDELLTRAGRARR